MTNTEIATLISERIGPRPVPFESVRALALEIYQDLGGTEGDEDFEDIYAILLATIPLAHGGGGAVIDDNNVSTNTTWSSSKIVSELDASLADYATIAEVDASMAEKADKSELENYATWNVVNTSLNLKQDTLIPGENITIQNNVISAAGTDLSDYYTKSEVDTALASKADNSDLDAYATWSVVETSLGLKANTSDVNDALDLKADKSELNDYAKLDDISTFVTQNDASVYATKTSVNNKANKNDIDIPYNNDGYDWSVLNRKADGIYRVSVIYNSTTVLQKGWLIAIKYVVGPITQYTQKLLLTQAQNLSGTIGFEIWERESSDGTTWTNSLHIIPKIDDFSVGILQTYSSDKIEKLIAALDASIADCATKNDVSVYAEKTYVNASLATKQDTLIAGENITIDENNVISAAGGDLSNYYTKAEVDTALSGKVDDSDLNNYYNKTEIDTALAGKVDDSDLDAYATWSVVETSLGLKADKTELDDYATIVNVNTSLGNYYTKSEVDTALSGKVDNADLDDYYTKTQIDTSINNALALKADKTELNNYATKNDVSAFIKQPIQTISTLPDASSNRNYIYRLASDNNVYIAKETLSSIVAPDAQQIGNASMNSESLGNWIYTGTQYTLKASDDSITLNAYLWKNTASAGFELADNLEIFTTVDAEHMTRDASVIIEAYDDEGFISIDGSTFTFSNWQIEEILATPRNLDTIQQEQGADLSLDLKYVTATTWNWQNDASVYATKAYVDSSLALKANKTYVDSSLNNKANTSYVDNNFAKLVICTQSQYNNLQVKDPSTLYIISDVS